MIKHYRVVYSRTLKSLCELGYTRTQAIEMINENKTKQKETFKEW